MEKTEEMDEKIIRNLHKNVHKKIRRGAVPKKGYGATSIYLDQQSSIILKEIRKASDNFNLSKYVSRKLKADYGKHHELKIAIEELIELQKMRSKYVDALDHKILQKGKEVGRIKYKLGMIE